MSRTSIIAIAALVGLATTTPSLARTHHRVTTYGTAYGQPLTNFGGVKSRRGADTARAVYRNPDRGVPVPCHGSSC